MSNVETWPHYSQSDFGEDFYFNIFWENLPIANHNAYHLGELVVLIKTLFIWPYS